MVSPDFDMQSPSYQKSRRDGKGQFSVDKFAGDTVLGRYQVPNLAKELVHPGQQVAEILMRTNLLDVNEARDVALLLSKFDEFEMEEEKRTILYLLAARCSVGERARLELLQALTGIVAPSIMGVKSGNKQQKGGEE